MFRKIALTLALISAAGVASAGTTPAGSCMQVLWMNICPPNSGQPVQAPEIDPASAMTGLTLLAGGLTVLRGRRRKSSK